MAVSARAEPHDPASLAHGTGGLGKKRPRGPDDEHVTHDEIYRNRTEVPKGWLHVVVTEYSLRLQDLLHEIRRREIHGE